MITIAHAIALALGALFLGGMIAVRLGVMASENALREAWMDGYETGLLIRGDR